MQKAQGSMEYLLIISGGLIVAIIVISAVIALAGTGSSGAKYGAANQVCKTYLDQSECETADLAIVESVEENCPTGNSADSECCWDEDKPFNQKCLVNPSAIYS